MVTVSSVICRYYIWPVDQAYSWVLLENGLGLFLTLSFFSFLGFWNVKHLLRCMKRLTLHSIRIYRKQQAGRAICT